MTNQVTVLDLIIYKAPPKRSRPCPSPICKRVSRAFSLMRAFCTKSDAYQLVEKIQEMPYNKQKLAWDTLERSIPHPHSKYAKKTQLSEREIVQIYNARKGDFTEKNITARGQYLATLSLKDRTEEEKKTLEPTDMDLAGWLFQRACK